MLLGDLLRDLADGEMYLIVDVNTSHYPYYTIQHIVSGHRARGWTLDGLLNSFELVNGNSDIF